MTLYPSQQPLLKYSQLIDKIPAPSPTCKSHRFDPTAQVLDSQLIIGSPSKFKKDVLTRIRYNYLIMTKSLIAFLSLLLIIHAQQTNIFGGLQPYTDLNSTQFVTLLEQLNARVPEINGFHVVKAQRQLVNGLQYVIDFESDNGSSIQVVAVTTFTGGVSIKSVSPVKPAVVPDNGAINGNTGGSTDNKPNTNSTAIIGGGFTVIPELPAKDKQGVLNEVLKQHPESKDYQLVKIESQVVNGVNYRLTYEQPDRTTVQYTIFVPLDGSEVKPNITNNSSQSTGGNTGGIVTNPNITRPLDDQPADNNTSDNKPTTNTTIPIPGGRNVITDPKLYQGALDAILKENPSFTGYTVSSAESQVVAGTNYYLTLVDGLYNLANFLVFNDLTGGYKVTLLLFEHAFGYTPAKIQRYVDECIKRQPSISKATLVQASNIWPLNKEGLKLNFKKPEGGFTNAFIYTVNGADSFSFFDS